MPFLGWPGTRAGRSGGSWRPRSWPSSRPLYWPRCPRPCWPSSRPRSGPNCPSRFLLNYL